MVAESHGALGDLTAERSARRPLGFRPRADSRAAQALLGWAHRSARCLEKRSNDREALALFIRLGDKHGQTRCWLATGERTPRRSPGLARALEQALETARRAHARTWRPSRRSRLAR
jgi:hypothetical protein